MFLSRGASNDSNVFYVSPFSFQGGLLMILLRSIYVSLLILLRSMLVGARHFASSRL